MNSSEKLQQSINELRHLTGLPIEIKTDETSNTEDILKKVRSLSEAYRIANQKEDVIRRWLTGELSDVDFFAFSDRIHLDPCGRRVVYLIQFGKDIYPEITLFLKNIFPNEQTWIIPFSQTQILVICRFQEHRVPAVRETAYELLDSLNTELMEQVNISYSAITDQPEQLPVLCRQVLMTMQVGNIFYPNQIIYGYDDLGIGRLLYDISEETLKDFIRDQIGEQFLAAASPAFASDIQNTVNCFLNNDMNIAETARQLHIHRNTLLYRLEQIENETGLDIRRFEHAMTYRICSMILLYLK